MSRGQGRVYRPKDSQNWWLDYSVRGVRHREPTGTSSHADAVRTLRDRIGKREDGQLIGHPERVLLAEYKKDATGNKELVGGLRALVERQYKIDERKSLPRLREVFDNLEAYFGADCRVMQITKTELDGYAAHRLQQGRARATVNQSLPNSAAASASPSKRACSR